MAWTSERILAILSSNAVEFPLRGVCTRLRRVMRYPCPCCGHLVFDEKPGSEDICLVCFWEDDLPQLRWPYLAEGANAVSLSEAQKNYAEYGAIDRRFEGDVRKARDDEPVEPEFRPISERDSFEGLEDSAPWPEDPTTLYYWRPTFWRKASTPSAED